MKTKQVRVLIKCDVGEVLMSFPGEDFDRENK